MSGYAVVDIETTGLSPFHHEIWEVGYILEPEGIEVEFTLPVDITRADPRALEVNRFHQRHFSGDAPEAVLPSAGAKAIAHDWKDRTIVAQPAIFDLTFIRVLLWRHEVAETWSHRAMHDLKTFALGLLIGADPGDFLVSDAAEIVPPRHIEDLSGSRMAEIFGVPKPADAHRALADARWTRDLAQAMGAIPR